MERRPSAALSAYSDKGIFMTTETIAPAVEISLPDKLSTLLALALQNMGEIDRDGYEPDYGICHVGAGRQMGSIARVGLDGAVVARTLGYDRHMSVSVFTFANVLTSNKIRALGELAQGDVASALYFIRCEDEITYTGSPFVRQAEEDEFIEALTWPQMKIVESGNPTSGADCCSAAGMATSRASRAFRSCFPI